jgi:nucleotide-binding universal stress UspA family protein
VLISTVVLPLDFSVGSGRAVRPAGSVAVGFGARVVPVTSSFGWGEKDPAVELAALTEPIGAVTDPPRVEDQFAPNAIERVVRSAREPLVCMATGAREGVVRLLGSVAEEVLRGARVPVLLVGPNSQSDDPVADVGPVLICVDGSEVSIAIVALATEWIDATGQSARLVRVRAGDEDADEIRASLAALAAQHEGTGRRLSWTIAEHVAPETSIVDLALTTRAPMIAMATHGRSGLDRIVMGSVTTKVVRDAPCPVLTVRPAGLGR